MTIKGALTWECHVKDWCWGKKTENDRTSFFFSWMVPVCFSSAWFSFLCFDNSAVPLVPIKHGETNWIHTNRVSEWGQQRWATLCGEFLAYRRWFKSQGWLHRSAAAQSLPAIIKQQGRAWDQVGLCTVDSQPDPPPLPRCHALPLLWTFFLLCE